MRIDVVDTLDQFKEIKEEWEWVYQSDPKSLFFISWVWLNGRLNCHEAYEQPWMILAAKETEPNQNYVAFFPLVINTDEKLPGQLYNELSIIGVTDAMHIPFICLPNYEKDVASAFANYLLQHFTAWSTLTIANLSTADTRSKLLLEDFPKENYLVQELHHTSDVDSIDNNIVPHILLPQDWDIYLQEKLSSNTRQKVKRLLRKVSQNGEFRVTQPTAETLDQHIKVLLNFWEKSWSGRKGNEHCRNILENADLSLRRCFEYHCLYLPVLWRNNQPLGAIANLIDWQKKSMLFWLGGRDEAVKNLSSGLILHALSIQFAIQNQFEVYDFLMGNEAYKFSLGAQPQHIKILTLQRRGESQRSPQLDIRTLPQALEIASIYHQAGRLSEAGQCYRQILHTQPEHAEALYGLGVICQRTGDWQGAETSFKKLLELQPDNLKAWFSLGTLYQTQGHLHGADQTFRRALDLPTVPVITAAIFHNLGYLLQQQGDWDGAIDCYQQAKDLQPECVEADVIWANALYEQGKLSSEKYSHYANLNMDLGDQRRQVGDLSVAIAYYQQAIAMQPDLAEASYYLGLTLQIQGDVDNDNILACYQRAWQLKPAYREAEVAVANILYDQKQLPPSENNQYALANYELGNKYQKQQELEVAISYYRQATLMQPELLDAYSHLALMLQLKGEESWDEAIACYQKALNLNPADPTADIGIATILYHQGKLSQSEQLRYADRAYTLGNSQKELGDLQAAIDSYRIAISMNSSLTDAKHALRTALQERDNVTIKVSCVKQ
ncbi:GNAT family N-acetyltransferase [Adonisia turfae]|uniref:GNAT family N-acetyltransferase n=1 Tax=Adonisia turfae CCMR0081 TaxID=2292702 RepID=A0A6M0RNH7_9CYAN|nr:GNAT family N-acetyltransferase [Adonisia turfae]NEZ57689.1 GNAT family N-acetyltransferase [Adonisia turfae CCMR0081]